MDSIRFASGGGSRRGTPGPTRDSSPARSVRFVDEFQVGGGQSQGDRQAPPLAENPVEEGEGGLGRDVKELFS